MHLLHEGRHARDTCMVAKSCGRSSLARKLCLMVGYRLSTGEEGVHVEDCHPLLGQLVCQK